MMSAWRPRVFVFLLSLFLLPSSQAYTAVVTGATGYLGLHLVQELLEQGHSVRGTFRGRSEGSGIRISSNNGSGNIRRSTSDETDASLRALHSLQKRYPPGRLELYEADLTLPGSFGPALSLCSSSTKESETCREADQAPFPFSLPRSSLVLFHTAGPFYRDFADAEKEIVHPILEGTLHLLASAKTARSVSATKAERKKQREGPDDQACAEGEDGRNTQEEEQEEQEQEEAPMLVSTELELAAVVITSSSAALRGPGDRPTNGKHFTEEDWNTSSERRGPGMQPYQWAKAEAERAALRWGRDERVNVLSALPSMMLGPPASLGCSPLCTSQHFMRDWILAGEGEGKEGIRGREGGPSLERKLICDVRDVAKAHVAAAERGQAGRRYIVSTESRVTPLQVSQALSAALAPPDTNTNTSITTSTTSTTTNRASHLARLRARVTLSPEQLERAEAIGARVGGGRSDKEVCAQAVAGELGVLCRPFQDTIRDMALAMLPETLPAAGSHG